MPNENVDKLVAEVAEDKTAKESAITLLNGLSAIIADIKAQLEAQGIDNATLNQLATDLDSSTNALADAVVANTPSA